MILTKAQEKSIDSLKARWSSVSEPRPLVGDRETAMVVVTSESTGITMTLGISPDGYVGS